MARGKSGPFRLLILALVVLHQMAFNLISRGMAQKTLVGVQGLLRQQFTDSDPYKLAQTLSDLENLQFLQCSKLTHVRRGTVYLDLSYRWPPGRCQDHPFSLVGLRREIILYGVNGMPWKVEFLSLNDSFFQGTRLVSLILLLLLCSALWKRKEELLRLEREKGEALWKLARQVAHDIRSPLGALENALAGLAGSRRKETDISAERGKVISGCIGQIRNIALHLLEQDHRGIQKSPGKKLKVSDLGPLLENLLAEKRMQFSEGPEVSFLYQQEFSGKAPDFSSLTSLISLEEVELKRVLHNVIDNSVEVEGKGEGEEKRKVVLKVKVDHQNLILSVEDNGPGIPAEVLEKIGKEEVTFGKKKGNGLGLLYVQEKLSLLQGRMTVDSQAGKGTLVRLHIPLRPPFDVVHIEDDSYVRWIWEEFAREKGLLLLSLECGETLGEWASAWGNETRFYVDWELGEGRKKGTEILRELSERGWKELYLTTGYEKGEIPAEPFVKEILGKSPPHDHYVHFSGGRSAGTTLNT